MRKIYLAGGFFSHANYGDVVQARAWVDFYKQHGFQVAVLYVAKGPEKKAEFRHFLGEHPELVDYSSVLKADADLSRKDVLHLYGGGYLNSVWGSEFSKLLLAFGRRGAKTFSTGTQIDQDWARDYYKRIRSVSNVQWLSVRDPYSRKYLRTDQPLLCDDSLLYFLESNRPQPSLAQSAVPKKIIAHFNLTDYVTKQLSDQPSRCANVFNLLQGKKEPRGAMVEGFVRNYLQQGYTFTILQNFPSPPDEVIEGERLFTDRKLLSQVTMQDTFAAEKDGASFLFGVANSFHAAIMMRVCLNTPVYFLALNDYYKQKVAALIEYGLVDKTHVVRRLNWLSRLQPIAVPPKSNLDAIRSLTTRVEALKRKVLEIVSA